MIEKRLADMGYNPVMITNIIAKLPEDVAVHVSEQETTAEAKAEFRKWILSQKENGEWYPHP